MLDKMLTKLSLILPIIVILSTIGFAFAVPPDIHLNGGINFQGTSFHRGDLIQFYGWSNANQDWKAGYFQVGGAIFDVNITDPDGKSVFEKNFTADANGSIAFSLPITNDFQFGKYTVNYAVSKEGYDVHQFGNQMTFFVSRQKSDIVEAKGYDFKLLIDPVIKYQSYPKLQISICPSPNVFNNESFVDPDTGQSVETSHGLVIYHLIPPNGTETDKNQYGQTLYNWFDSTCPNSQIESNFYANVGGNWTAYAVAKWISNGTMYEMQSKPASFHVTEPQFLAKITKIVNANTTSLGFFTDISQDNKFIIFSTGTTENGKDVNSLWMVRPDGTGLQEIEKVYKYILKTKISPSGKFVLWSGEYYVEKGAPDYGLFAYDIEGNKLVQISNGSEDPDSVGDFHWTKDNKIAYIARHWDNIFHTLTTNLVIAYPNGTVIKMGNADELSSLDLYKDPDRLGNMSVSAESYSYSGGGAVVIKSSDGYEEKIFDVPNGSYSPSGASISSDGKSIVFVYGTGVYVASLNKPVTEYKPISQTTNTSNVSPQPNQPVNASQNNQSPIKFASPVNLSTDYKSQNPHIAASGNNVYIVWEDFTSGNNDIYFKKSADGGLTFGKAVNLSNNNGSSFDPAIAVSGDNVYVAWTDESKVNKGYQNIMFAKSVDGGNIFGSPIVLSAKTVFTEVTSNNSPRIMVSGNNVYVLWTVSNYNWQNIFLSRSNDNGNTFNNPVDLSNADGTTIAQTPDIAASGSNVYVIWQAFDQSRNPLSGIIGLARSSDNGVSFNVKNLTNSGVSWDPRIYTGGETIYAFWREDNLGPWSGMVIFAKSLDGGMTFNMTKAGNGGLFADPSSVWAGTGGSPFISFTNGTDIFLTKSHDGGMKFSNPIDLSNNAWGPGPYDETPVPKIYVVGHNVFVAWRYTVSPEGKHAPFISASTDSGDTFSKPINLSQSSGDTTAPPQMAISGNHVYVVYTDTIPSGSDIFLASGTANMTLSDESGQPPTENNPAVPPANIFAQIVDWIKQVFHWS